MLLIKEITADGVKKFALLRLEKNGCYTELGVYARNSYAVKKAKAIMSETQEFIECKFNGVIDLWKLQDDKLVSTEQDLTKRFDEIVALSLKAESGRDFRQESESQNHSNDSSILQKSPTEKSLELNQWINGAKDIANSFIDEELREPFIEPTFRSAAQAHALTRRVERGAAHGVARSPPLANRGGAEK